MPQMADNTPELDSALYFENADVWRNWLASNYDKRDHVWLIIYKKGSGKASLTLESAVMEAICFGWIDGKLKSIDNERYILRYGPRKPKSPWSQINKDRAMKLMRDGKMTDAGLKKIDEARNNGLWDAAYTSRTREEMPDDLEKALKADKKAQDNFNSFAASYRNNYIGWINGAKTEATRRTRIAEVVRRAADNRKPGMP